MPSCSSSSNIQGTSTVVNPTGSEARLSLQLLANQNVPTAPNGGYTLDASVVAGAVIRYSPTEKTYFASKADNNENSEVVGVVESLNSNGDATVVLRGLIEYPSGATLYNIPPIDAGVAVGGSGGNDIWFLSGVTAGAMQNLEPINIGEIVKPVMQAIASSDEYNYQVLNYIGYSVGGEAVAEEINRLPVGTALIIPADANVPVGWVSAEEEKEILIANYPSYYSYVGKSNGYVEKITVSSSPASSSKGKAVTQKTAGSLQSSGRVKSVDTVNNQIYVRKNSSQGSVSTDKDLFINNVDFGKPTATEIHSVFTPKITAGPNSELTYYENGRAVKKSQRVILKIQDIAGVSVPSKLTMKELFVTDKLTAGNSGASYDDVADEITRIKSRLTDLENKVIGIS